MSLTPAQRQNLRKRFIDGVKNVFSGDPGNTIYGQPVEDFIAGDEPLGPLGNFQREAGRRVCRRWAAGRSPTILPGRDLYYRQLCEPYIENEFGPLGPGTAVPPFEGGQCPTNYNINFPATTGYLYRRVVCATGVIEFEGAPISRGIANVKGPLQNIFAKTTATGQCGPRTVVFAVVDADGVELVAGTMASTDTTRRIDVLEINPVITRSDGLPDNCGSLPDNWEPGTGPTIPPETGPIPSPPGWQIPDFDIEITVDPDGTINIDFGDDEPDITIDPDGGSDEPPPGDQGQPGDGGEAGADPAEGEAPDGTVLVGLRLQLIEASPNAKRFAPSVFRGGAYIYMGGDVGLDQDFAGSMLIEDQFIFAEKDNLTRWKVIAKSGFRWSVTPYYREAE